MPQKKTKKFILYDGRARFTLDTDEATVLDTADTEKEARSCKGDWPEDSIWVEYDIETRDGKDFATNENFRWDIKC